MLTVEIKPYINADTPHLASCVQPYYELAQEINTAEDPDITLDFSRCRYLTPALILCLENLLLTSKKNIRCINLTSYLQTIGFADSKQHSNKRRTTYLPIISFNPDEQGNIINDIITVLKVQNQIPANIISGLRYILQELIDNIREHSESAYGQTLVQAFPKHGFIDIALANEGLTIKENYKKKNILFRTDTQAMKAANSRISSKNRPDAESRGFGIFTSKKMSVKGLAGQFMMISGNAMYYKDEKHEFIISTPKDTKLQGSVVAMRIYYNNPSFNIYSYIE